MLRFHRGVMQHSIVIDFEALVGAGAYHVRCNFVTLIHGYSNWVL